MQIKRIFIFTLLTLFFGSLVGPLLTSGGQGTFSGIVHAQDAEEDPEAEEEDEEEDCEEASDSSFDWILCPILRGMDKAVGFVDAQINEVLFVRSEVYEGDALKLAAARLRNIAYIVLVPIMLVMVLGTALGSSLVDAYTVKKALPRLIIAVLFMALSFPIGIFLIELANALGTGVGGLIASAFGGMRDITLASLFEAEPGKVFMTLAGAGTAAWAIGVNFFVVMSYAGVALLGMLFGYVLLAGRQFLLIALMLLAPVAILSWIFPGNDKLWGLWKNSFFGLLMLYPLIMVVIAGGRVFAKIIADAAPEGSSVTGGPFGFTAIILILVAYVAPYFLIPATFKLAGGTFANLAGKVNDKGRGVFDRQRKRRGEEMDRMKLRNKNYGRLNERGDNTKFAGRNLNRVTRGINRTLGAPHNARDVGQALRHGSLDSIKAGEQTGKTILGAAAMETDNAKANKGNDAYSLAMADEEMAVNKIDKAKAERKSASADKQAALVNIDAAKRRGDVVAENRANDEYKQAMEKMNSAEAGITSGERGLALARRDPNRKSSGAQLAHIQQLAENGREFSPGLKGYQELSDMVRSATGNNEGAYAAAMNQAQSKLKEAGHFEMAGINNGAGYEPEGGLNGIDPTTFATKAKPETIMVKGELARDHIDSAVKARDRAVEAQRLGDTNTFNSQMEVHNSHMQKAEIHRHELEASSAVASGQNREAINQQLESIKPSDPGRMTPQQAVFSTWQQTPAKDPNTGTTITREKRTNYVRGVSPVTGPGAWSPEDINRGWRTEQKEVTQADVARERAGRVNPVDIGDNIGQSNNP